MMSKWRRGARVPRAKKPADDETAVRGMRGEDEQQQQQQQQQQQEIGARDRSESNAMRTAKKSRLHYRQKTGRAGPPISLIDGVNANERPPEHGPTSRRRGVAVDVFSRHGSFSISFPRLPGTLSLSLSLSLSLFLSRNSARPFRSRPFPFVSDRVCWPNIWLRCRVFDIFELISLYFGSSLNNRLYCLSARSSRSHDTSARSICSNHLISNLPSIFFDPFPEWTDRNKTKQKKCGAKK